MKLVTYIVLLGTTVFASSVLQVPQLVLKEDSDIESFNTGEVFKSEFFGEDINECERPLLARCKNARYDVSCR
jgi:hypothetical protein